MLVSEVIERLQKLDPDAEVEAYIIPVPLFPVEVYSDEPKKAVRCEVKQGYWPDYLQGDKYIHHRVHGYKPRSVLLTDDDYSTVEEYCRAVGVTFDEGLRRLLSFSLKELAQLDRKEWKALNWFR